MYTFSIFCLFFFLLTAHHANAFIAVVGMPVRLTVRPSVKHWYFVKTTLAMIKKALPMAISKNLQRIYSASRTIADLAF